MAAKRRRMAWTELEKDYRFEGPAGPASLADLFEGRRQLIVYRAFYARTSPRTRRAGARTRSGLRRLLLGSRPGRAPGPPERQGHDAGVRVAAPQAEIQGLQQRMGWELIPWYTLTDDFDADFGVDQWHGTNAFIRDDDRIFRTYFVHDRGDEQLGSTWSYLDITTLGRQEEWEDSPEDYPQTPPYQWWNYHDAYGNGG